MDFSKYKKALVQSLRMNRPKEITVPANIEYKGTIDAIDFAESIAPLRDFQRQLINDLLYAPMNFMPEEASQAEDRVRRPRQNVPITYMGIDPARPDASDVTVIRPVPMDLNNHNRSHWISYMSKSGKLLPLGPEAEGPFEPHYKNRLEAVE